MLYLSLIHYIMVDQSSNYVSKELKINMASNVISIDVTPMETPGTIFTVRRYHTPLRVSYRNIRSDVNQEIRDYLCLKMAIFAITSTIGQEFPCPILLVFGALPRTALTYAYISQINQ